MPSSSSSEDETNLDLLREAADYEFINDSLYKGTSSGKLILLLLNQTEIVFY